MDFTTAGLLASIRRRASIPSTAVTGSADSDLLAYANEELRLGLVARILELRESYFKRNLDTAISGTEYRIPTRAIGGKLHNVSLLDSAGAVIAELPEIPDERLSGYTGASLAGYNLRGNFLVLVPSATTTAVTLRQTYYAQPNELVATPTAANTVLSNVNTSTGALTMASTTGITTSTPVDLVRGTEGFESLSLDLTPSAVTGTTVTLATLPTGLAAGDYVALARQSPVPQIPSEFHPILAQRVACAYLEANNAEGLDAAKAKLQEMEANIGTLSSPRNDGGAKKTINRFSALGRLGGGRSRWGV